MNLILIAGVPLASTPALAQHQGHDSIPRLPRQRLHSGSATGRFSAAAR